MVQQSRIWGVTDFKMMLMIKDFQIHHRIRIYNKRYLNQINKKKKHQKEIQLIFFKKRRSNKVMRMMRWGGFMMRKESTKKIDHIFFLLLCKCFIFLTSTPTHIFEYPFLRNSEAITDPTLLQHFFTEQIICFTNLR